MFADFFQEGLEFPDGFRVFGGEVVPLGDVDPEVVEFGRLVIIGRDPVFGHPLLGHRPCVSGFGIDEQPVVMADGIALG